MTTLVRAILRRLWLLATVVMVMAGGGLVDGAVTDFQLPGTQPPATGMPMGARVSITPRWMSPLDRTRSGLRCRIFSMLMLLVT